MLFLTNRMTNKIEIAQAKAIFEYYWSQIAQVTYAIIV